MPLTAQARRLLDRFEELGVRPYDELTVLEARAVVDASRRLGGEPPEIDHVHDVLATGADGQLPVRVYHPGRGVRPPMVVYFHGGGWVTGGVEVADTACRMLAAESGFVVASVEYRRSPETKFPGPTEDAYAATRWLAGRGEDLGAEVDRLVVCGDSAGGNLAAAVALMARDRGGPAIACQVLMYAALAAMPRDGFPSHSENGEGYGLTRGGMQWFWDQFLATPQDGLDPYASPLLADRLDGLPPAIVVTAEYDLLRDEGLAYAERLRDAGVRADVVSFPGVIHGFFWMAGALDEGRDVHGAIAERMRRYT